MATGLLQNQTWNVGRAAKQCAACQTDLTPGAAYTLHVLGLPQAGEDSFATEVAQFSFLIEFPPDIEQH